MAEAVLDASALLAFLCNEPGADTVAAVLTRSCISAVNLAETISKLVEYGKPLDEVGYQIERLRIPVIPFDADQARIIASLWKTTRVELLNVSTKIQRLVDMYFKRPRDLPGPVTSLSGDAADNLF